MRKENAEIVEKIQSVLMREEVEEKYKSKPSDFSRKRKLPFNLLILFMLRNLYKNLALELSSFFKQLGKQTDFTLSKSAFSQSRKKVKPAFFQDLLHHFNREFYTDNDERVKLLQGFRLVAVDSSTLDLPFTQALAAVYGTYANQYQTSQVQARISVAYDLLNHMILDAVLQPSRQAEREAALQHLTYYQPGDLLVYDRGYPSFDLIYQHLQQGVRVVMRLQNNFNNEVKAFLASEQQQQVIAMKPAKKASLKNKPYKRDTTISIRLVKVALPSGETELLLTTLLDEQLYSISFLTEVYALRWRVETRYDLLKNVVVVENFSGYSQEAILQDFYCSMFLLNMQALLTEDLQEELQERYGHRKYDYKINTAVAIGQLKENMVELFTTQEPQQLLETLKQQFLRHAEPIRPKRKYPRKKNYYRSRKKPKLMKNRKSVL